MEVMISFTPAEQRLQPLLNADIAEILRTSNWNSLCTVMKCESSNREVLHFCCAVLK